MGFEKYSLEKKSNEGAPFEVKGPDGNLVKNSKGKVFTIYLMGRDSKVCQKLISDIKKRDAENNIANKSDKQVFDDEVNIISSCGVGWENFEVKGKDVKFSKAEFVKWISDPGFSWFKEFCDISIGKRSAFLDLA